MEGGEVEVVSFELGSRSSLLLQARAYTKDPVLLRS